jgi:hypothetical protein
MSFQGLAAPRELGPDRRDSHHSCLEIRCRQICFTAARRPSRIPPRYRKEASWDGIANSRSEGNAAHTRTANTTGWPPFCYGVWACLARERVETGGPARQLLPISGSERMNVASVMEDLVTGKLSRDAWIAQCNELNMGQLDLSLPVTCAQSGEQNALSTKNH